MTNLSIGRAIGPEEDKAIRIKQLETGRRIACSILRTELSFNMDKCRQIPDRRRLQFQAWTVVQFFRHLFAGFGAAFSIQADGPKRLGRSTDIQQGKDMAISRLVIQRAVLRYRGALGLSGVVQ